MAEADRRTIAAGTPGIDLMERAGRAVAEAVMAQRPSHVTVVAGPGNNGGDGFVAARILAEHAYRTTVLLVGERARLKGDAATAAERWRGVTEPASPERIATGGVIVDALFGAGLDRPVDGLARVMIEAMNERESHVIAVDLPSGINGNTGAVMGAAVRAQQSITFFRKKPGHLLMPGREHCGSVTIEDIGIRAAVLDEIRPQTYGNDMPLWLNAFPVPRLDGHKYSRGHAVVVSGGLSFTGAARLAARGALRAGAGLVTIASPRDALAAHAASNTAVMVREVDGASALTDFLSDHRLNAVVIGPGCGVGAATRDLVLAVLAGERAVVLDADALTSFEDQPSALFEAICRRGLSPTVMTPHAGELSRIFKYLVSNSQVSQKLEISRTAAKKAALLSCSRGRTR